MGIINKLTKKNEKEQKDAVENQAEVADTKKKVSTKKETKTTETVAGKSRARAYRTLVRPLISEKASVNEVQGKYTFVVDVNATKEDIKNAVETVYGIRPISISTANFEGKRKRFGLIRGRRSDWKKAVVTLPKGRTMNIHEGV